MKKVLLASNDSTHITDVPDSAPIFAICDGKVVGMVVNEGAKWIIRIGGMYGYSGHHVTRMDCMLASADEYSFAIDINARCLNDNQRT